MSDNQGDGGKITPGGYTLPPDAPAGILDFLVGIQANESGFDYFRDQGSPGGSIGTYGGGGAEGFGAYQFTGPDSTQVQQAVADNWNPASQDEIAYNLAKGYWDQWHDWAKVTEAWYGPGTVDTSYNDVLNDPKAPSYPDWQNVKAALQGHANLPSSWVFGPGYQQGLTSEQVQEEIGGTIVPENSGGSSFWGSVGKAAGAGQNPSLASADISSMNTAGQICAQLDTLLNPIQHIPQTGYSSIGQWLSNPLGALAQDTGINTVQTDLIATAQMIAFRALFTLGFLLVAAVGVDSLLKHKERYPLKLAAGSRLGGRGPGIMSFFKTGGAGTPGEKPPSLNQMIALQREQRQQARQEFNATIASAREMRIAQATQHRMTLTEQKQALAARKQRSEARTRNARLRFEQSEAARKVSAETRRVAEDKEAARRRRQRAPKRIESIPE